MRNLTTEMEEQRLVRQALGCVTRLNRIMDQLRKTHPLAHYYLAGDSFHVMRGPSHDDSPSTRPMQSNSLGSRTLTGASGGDW